MTAESVPPGGADGVTTSPRTQEWRSRCICSSASAYRFLICLARDDTRVLEARKAVGKEVGRYSFGRLEDFSVSVFAMGQVADDAPCRSPCCLVPTTLRRRARQPSHSQSASCWPSGWRWSPSSVHEGVRTGVSGFRVEPGSATGRWPGTPSAFSISSSRWLPARPWRASGSARTARAWARWPRCRSCHPGLTRSWLRNPSHRRTFSGTTRGCRGRLTRGHRFARDEWLLPRLHPGRRPRLDPPVPQAAVVLLARYSSNGASISLKMRSLVHAFV